MSVHSFVDKWKLHQIKAQECVVTTETSLGSMKFLVVFCLLLAYGQARVLDSTSTLALAKTLANQIEDHERADLDAFLEFITKYERKYQDLAEVTARFRNVQASLKRAAQQQAENPHAKFGLTQFSDLSIEEFKRYNGYKRTSARRNDPLPSFQSGSTPDAFDWRENK
uniref:Inhibitor_I29 domain-containing protein n=1 Tax=Bursaphelenchus xylophilus TaxID=6326 RepID=A0A1I7SKQ8_BURXY